MPCPSPIRPYPPLHRSTNPLPKLRARPPRPAHLPTLPASLHRLSPPRPRQHPRANLLLRPRHHRHLPRRLLRDPHGRARHRVPIQYHWRANVLGEHDELFGDRAAVWETGGRAVDGGGAVCVFGGVEVGGSVHGGDL